MLKSPAACPRQYTYHVNQCCALVQVFSAVGDPARREDSAYLGHFANDGTSCLSPDTVEDYRRESTSAANTSPVWVEGCHCALQADRPIRQGEEILFSYGEGYWLSRRGHEGVGSRIRCVGTASPRRAPSERLKHALEKARPKKGQAKKKKTAASEKAKLRKKAAADASKGARARGFG